MQYTIGVKVASRKNGEVSSTRGIYALSYISPGISDIVKRRSRIYIVNDFETAQNLSRYLSRIYRFEFRSRAKRQNLDMKQFAFFPLKLSQSKYGKFQTVVSSGIKNNNHCYDECFSHIDTSKVKLCYIKL